MLCPSCQTQGSLAHDNISSVWAVLRNMPLDLRGGGSAYTKVITGQTLWICRTRFKVKGHIDHGQRSLWQTKADGLTSTSSCFIRHYSSFLIKDYRKRSLQKFGENTCSLTTSWWWWNGCSNKSGGKWKCPRVDAPPLSHNVRFFCPWCDILCVFPGMAVSSIYIWATLHHPRTSKRHQSQVRI